ncbi:DUF1956 domain-containing protein [Fundidesulfovibrio butyratiphilus]
MPQAATPKDKRLTKGQHTRQRLLEEALRLFAEKGYAAVGIREVAGAAETNVASIAFHFSGKEGLYGAVIEHVADELAGLHRTVMDEADRQGRERGEDSDQRIVRIVGMLASKLLLSNRSQWMSLLLQREFITPTAFFPKLYERAIRPTLEALQALIDTRTGAVASPEDSKILAFSLFILASSFQRNRNTFLHFANKNEYSKDDVERISRVIAAFVQGGLPGAFNPRERRTP